MHNSILGIAGGMERRQTRTQQDRPVGQLLAAHPAGHDHVGEQQVDISLPLEYGERCLVIGQTAGKRRVS